MNYNFKSFMAKFFLSLLVGLFVATGANAQMDAAGSNMKPDLISEGQQSPIGNLDKTPMLGHVVYSKQPDEATISKLKDEGFKMVISVRFEDEPVGFDAREAVEKNGMAFQQISFYKGSINDQPRAVDAEAIEQISELLSATAASGSKVLMHCQSGQRAAGALAAVLYKDYGFSKDQALDYASKAGMTSKNVAAALDEYMDNLKR